MDCIQGVFLGGVINWPGVVIATLSLIALIGITVFIHELGHAIPGWLIGGSARPNGFGLGLFTLFQAVRWTDGRLTRYSRFMPHVDFDNYDQLSVRERRLLIGGGPFANLATGLIGLCLLDGALSLNPRTAFEDLLATFQAWGYGCDVFLWGAQQDTISSLLYLSSYLFSSVSIFLGVANLVPIPKATDGYWLIYPSEE